MEIYCTRPGCPRPVNRFPDLDDNDTLVTAQQKFCTSCGMPLILVSRYLPIRLLGRGGFGAAFLARDRYNPGMRQCVVKQFQPSGNLTQGQLQMAQELFKREGQVLDKLGHHPQIPDLLAFFPLDVLSRTPGQSDKFFYLAQEFVDGENLEELLTEKQRFSEAEVLELLEQILPVLKFVHENGSIHRDIKPSNIMRRRDGLYYLLDFGAVKQITTGAVGSGQGGGQAGTSSTRISSIGFAPPEQMRGDQVYPATDLYALGVTCIMLLTGKQPNELYDTYSDNWNWRAYTQVSDRLEAVLNRMLMPTPSLRFQSAEEVLTALKPAAQPLASPSPKPTPSQSPSAPVVQPAAQPPVPTPPPSKPRPLRPAFSILELLGGAAFTGFEGGLLAIALASLLGTAVAPTFWLILVVVLSAMVLAQSRRWIERVDLLIITGVTLAAVILLPVLHQAVGGTIQVILVVAVFSGLIAVTVTAVFRLIYNLLSRLL
jgi:serine/threonine protein kinase